MIQRSRKPAAAILLATALAASAYAWTTSADAQSGTGLTLAELEVAIADPNASVVTWLLYGQRLHQERRFHHAALAFERALEEDPYSRATNLQCAAALSQGGDADRYYAFLTRLLLIDPRLTQDLLGRPDARAFMAQERFHALLQQARAQAMD